MFSSSGALTDRIRDLCDWWIATAWHSEWLRAVGLSKGPPDAIETLIERGDFSISDASRSALFIGPYLKLQYATQALPFSRALEVALALAREKTPFSAEEVYVVPETTDERGRPSFFYIFKRRSIDAGLEGAAAAKTRIDHLGVNDGGKIRWLSSRALEELHPVFHHIRHWRRGLLVAALVLSIFGGVTYARAFLKYVDAERQLAQLIEVQRAEAQKVRKLLDLQQKGIAAVEAARKGKSRSLPVVRVWEELTRVLPDDVWLTDVAIDGHALTITGFASQSAASLITILDESPFFSDPSFVSPVVRIPGQPGERFEIRIELQRA